MADQEDRVPDTTVPDATVTDTTVPDITVQDTTVPDEGDNPDREGGAQDDITSDLQDSARPAAAAAVETPLEPNDAEDSQTPRAESETGTPREVEAREEATPQPPQSTSDESDYDAVLSMKRPGQGEEGGEGRADEDNDDDEKEVFAEEPQRDANNESAPVELHNGEAHRESGESLSQLGDQEESAERALDSDRLNDETLGVIQDNDSISSVSRGSLTADVVSEAAPDGVTEDILKDGEEKTVSGSVASVSGGGQRRGKGAGDPHSKTRGAMMRKGASGRAGTFSATSHNTETSERTRLLALRGKTGTPNSYYTDVTAEIKNIENRHLESREAVFQRAMTLMSTRCTSVTQMMEPLLALKDQPYGVHVPQYFYIQQTKPRPSTPVKAWRGYNGNVYFEPLHISGLGSGGGPSGGEQPHSESRAERIRNLIRARKPSAQSRQVSRSTTRQSGGTVRTWPASAAPGLVVLDRNAVLSQANSHLEEDLLLLQSQEATGSLTTRGPRHPATPRQAPARPQRRSAPPTRSRICRGSMVHKSKSAKQPRKGPALGVAGDGLATPVPTSPLLRTQTQYSLSSQRAATNSPDVVQQHLDHLPPLEHVRASLRHVEGGGGDRGQAAPAPSPYGRSAPLTDSPKPFVKYSPDFRSRRHNEAPYC